MTADLPDLNGLLDELDAAHAAWRDGTAGWRYQALDAMEALPRLVAAVRAVLARLDFADGTGQVVYGRSDGGAVWARDLRAALAAALAPTGANT